MENWKSYVAEGTRNSEAVLNLVKLLNQAGLDTETLLQQIALGEKASEQIINAIRGGEDDIYDAHQDTNMDFGQVLDAMAELVAPVQDEEDRVTGKRRGNEMTDADLRDLVAQLKE